jgi:MoeA C-terminal region (domain IV)
MVNLTASLKRIEFLITEFPRYWVSTFIRELPAPTAAGLPHRARVCPEVRAGPRFPRELALTVDRAVAALRSCAVQRLRRFLLAKVGTREDGQCIVVPSDKQGTAMLSTLTGSDGFIVLEEDRQFVRWGEPVDFLPMQGICPRPIDSAFLGTGALQRHTKKGGQQHEMKRVVQLRER